MDDTTHTHACHWCNAEFTPSRAAVRRGPVRYCGDKCRKSANNTRAMRGAQLYDIWMAARHQRTTHSKLGGAGMPAQTIMSRMAADWLADDERNGRVRRNTRGQVIVGSWNDPRDSEAVRHAIALVGRGPV